MRQMSMGAELVARAAAAQHLPVIHISTDYVFDGTKIGAYVETDPIAPLGVYGRTKAEGEARVREENPRHFILRTAWVYGRFGANFLKTILRLSRERGELRIVADQYGCPTATQDLAEAIFAIDRAWVAALGPQGPIISQAPASRAGMVLPMQSLRLRRKPAALARRLRQS